MRQREKHAHVKEVTGEKHQPKKKAQKIHPGKDDCGEDFSSLERMTGNMDSFTTFDQCLTPEGRSEFHVEMDTRTEIFLIGVEASLTPHHHFFGSSVPISAYHNTLEMPMMTEVYAFLEGRPAGEHHDIVEICGGTSKVSPNPNLTKEIRRWTQFRHYCGYRSA